MLADIKILSIHVLWIQFAGENKSYCKVYSMGREREIERGVHKLHGTAVTFQEVKLH